MGTRIGFWRFTERKVTWKFTVLNGNEETFVLSLLRTFFLHKEVKKVTKMGLRQLDGLSLEINYINIRLI